MKARFSYIGLWKIPFIIFLLSCFSFSAFAGDLIYSLSSQQGEVNGAQVNLTSFSVGQLTKGDVVDIALPDGTTVSGVIQRDNIDNLKSQSENKLMLVVSFEDNLGGAELIIEDNEISAIIFHDAVNKKRYRATIDVNGQGIMVEQDIDKFQCVDFPHPENDSAENIPPEISELIPDESTLRNLESRPGASKTLYLNYWGGTLTGTAWNANYNSGNPIVYTPYSSDSDTATFSSNDRYLMWLAWREAVEDYAAFDVNVTTKQSVYNATAVVNRSQMIATTTDYFFTGAGGVAYVGIFNETSDYYKTGWTWNSSATSFGQTISHEAGHQMGLLHDGTSAVTYYRGHGNWGPIMGAPFGKAYVQWSKGEYTDANNQENDLVIIENVLGTVADDAGNTIGTATALSLPTTDHVGHITADGLFSDADVYSFTAAAGAAYVDITPLLGAEAEHRAANLAMNVTLTNSGGSIIASMESSDTSPLDPTTNTLVFDGTLAAGTYYITITAVSPNASWATGFGEYGNGGEYLLNVSASGGGGTPSVTSPTPGSTLSGSTETFTWAANGTSVSQYYLYIGTTGAGSSDILSQDQGTTTSATISGFPSDGSIIYFRLWYNTGSWEYQDYTYTASGGGGGTPDITSPAPGSVLSGASETFSWSANGADVTEYQLFVGTTGVGSSNISAQSLGTANSTTVNGLPTNGSTVYVRLYYKVNGSFSSQDYTYTAATVGGGVPGISSPTPGSTLSGTTVTFTWAANGASVSQYYLYIGTTGAGSSDILAQDQGTTTSATISGFPSDGSIIYFRLWYNTGSWEYQDYTYTAATVGGGDPGISSPTPGSTLSGTTVTFTWAANGASVSQYYLYVGTTGVGSSDILAQDQGTATSATISGFPSDGSIIYFRLWYNTGSWEYQDYTYTASGGGGGTPDITSPAPGSVLSGASETFSWSANGANVTEYQLFVGTTGIGSSNIFAQSLGTANSTTVNGLPTNGSTVYVRLYYKVNGSFSSQDYTYTAMTNAQGFNEQFNGDISNWAQASGSWNNMLKHYLYANDSSIAQQWVGAGYSQESYTDLDYSVLIWRAGDEDYSNGLIIRSDDADGSCYNCYQFLYTRGGYISVWKAENGNSMDLQGWVASTAIATGDNWNLLRVVAQGSNLYFYINGSLVWSGSDSTHASGYVGVQAYKDASLGLWVDSAVLTTNTSSISELLSEDQLMRNEEANANPKFLNILTGAIAINK